MAGADYQRCTVCGCKAFYDANVSWEYERARQVSSLCNDCYQKGYRLAVVRNNKVKRYNAWLNHKFNIDGY